MAESHSLIPQIEGNSIYDFYQPYTGEQGTSGQVGGFDDPYSLYLSLAPIMQRNADREIGSAIGSIGMTGNRYSSGAQRAAGQIGANTAMDMNALLTGTLQNQYNTDADRAMMAASGLLNASGQVEGALGQRYGSMSGALEDRMRAWEQQRQAAMSSMRAQYADFEKNKYGTLPMLMGALSTSIGSPPEPILTTSGGKEGYGTQLMDLAALYYGSKGS